MIPTFRQHVWTKRGPKKGVTLVHIFTHFIEKDLQIAIQPIETCAKVWPKRGPKLVAPRGTFSQPLVACGSRYIRFLTRTQ